MKQKSVWKKFAQAWKWYVLGCYHCDCCPYSWNDVCFGCEDYDCGCVIYGDVRDTCRLLPPIRFLIGWPRKKKYQYDKAHEYDDLPAQIEENERQEKAMIAAVMKGLDMVDLHFTMPNNTTDPIKDKKAYITDVAFQIVLEYENEAHPTEYRTLRDEWKMLLRKTWKRFIRCFAPYFIKR